MAMDVLNDAELSIAPPDFTQAVMTQVCKLPAHTKPESINISLRILWGLSAIVLGIALLFAFNPEWLTAFPVMDNILASVSTLGQYISGLTDNLSPAYQGAGLSALNASLLFAVVVGTLLVVILRSEKSHNS